MRHEARSRVEDRSVWSRQSPKRVAANSRSSSRRSRLRFIRPLLFLLILGVSLQPTPAAAGDPLGGLQLPIDELGNFGVVTEAMTDFLDPLLNSSGLKAAAQAAKDAWSELEQGRVPLIGELEDPFNGNVEEAIEAALQNAAVAAEILEAIVGPAARELLTDILDSPLFADADFRITLPTGWVRVVRSGLEVSVYATVIGPFGARLTTGISNADPLANMTQPRMANPSGALALFADIAMAYSHLHMRKVLAPGLREPLIDLTPGIEAVTYVKIHDQWTKLRFASADPATLELDATISVGLKGGVRAKLMAELGAALTLNVKVKPARAAEIILGVIDEMEAEALRQEPFEDTEDVLAIAADVLRAGLVYLQDPDSVDPDDLGEVSLNAGVSGQLGIGIWDSGIAAISAGAGLTTRVPLQALVRLSADRLENLLDFGITLSDVIQRISKGHFEGAPASEMDAALDELHTASTELGKDVLDGLLALTTEIEMEAEFEVSLLGESDQGAGERETNIPLITYSVDLPIGELSDTLQNDTEAVGRAVGAAVEASAHLMFAGYDAQTDFDWSALSLGVTDGIKFSLQSMAVAPIMRVGFSEMPLTDLLETMEIHENYVRPILVGVMDAGRAGSLDPLRTAIEVAIDEIDYLVDDTFVSLLKSPRITFSTGIGANAELGAELGIKLGLGARLEGNVKTSFLFLLMDRPEYSEEHETTLAELSFPVNIGLTGEASLGEGVELEITGGITASHNLFDLTYTHWDGPLPTPAGMTVAGFEVLEFVGEVRNDESLTGSGYLLLPMGGIVSANFDVDANGHVLSGDWDGGFDLGPLGKLTLASGTLTDAGLHGIVDVGFFVADYTLTSSGWLYGYFEGNISIGGHQLTGFTLRLDENGFFSGTGMIDLGGFQAVTNLSLDENGFRGDSSLKLLGSTLVADDLRITPSGEMTGVFTGTLMAGTHELSKVRLAVAGGGLKGSARLDLPGIAAAEITLLVENGIITGEYTGQSPLFGTHMSSISLTISATGVGIHACVETDLLESTSSDITGLIDASAGIAKEAILKAKADVEAAQAWVDDLVGQLLKKRAEALVKLEAAVKKARSEYNEADAKFDDAVEALRPLAEAFDKAHAKLVAALDVLKGPLQDAKDDLEDDERRLNSLKRWYSKLSKIKKAIHATWYYATKATYEGYIKAAKKVLSGAQKAVDAAQKTLNEHVPSDALNAALALKNQMKKAADLMFQKLQSALQALRNPDNDPLVAPVLKLKKTADTELSRLLSVLTDLEKALGNAAVIANYIIDFGLTDVFLIESACFDADLGTLKAGSVVLMQTRGIFMGKAFSLNLLFDLRNHEEGFQDLAGQLEQSATTFTDAEDTTPPDVFLVAPTDWQNGDVTVSLSATDNVGGSGVEKIICSTSGAQEGAHHFGGSVGAFTVTAEGVTRVSAYAHDHAGNDGLVRSLTVLLDRTKPHVELTLPADPRALPFIVTVTASDPQASGTDFMIVSSTGAQAIDPTKIWGGDATVALTAAGDTTLHVEATDKAGNTQVFSEVVSVPDTTPPVVTPPSDVEDWEATGVLSAVDIGMATATDNVGVASIVSDAPNVFPVGTTIVTWTAEDTSGNSASATQRVTVVDTTAPVVTVPPDITDYEGTAPLSPIDIGMATATDAVGVVSIVSDEPAGFPVGITVVVWTATDAAGNSDIAIQTVEVVDTTAPVVTCFTDTSALWPVNHKMVPVEIEVQVTDACTRPFEMTMTCTVESDEADDSTGDGAFPGDVDGEDGKTSPVPVTLTWSDTRDAWIGVVHLRAERSAVGTGRTYSVHCEAQDASENVGTGNQVDVGVAHDMSKVKK